MWCHIDRAIKSQVFCWVWISQHIHGYVRCWLVPRRLLWRWMRHIWKDQSPWVARERLLFVVSTDQLHWALLWWFYHFILIAFCNVYDMSEGGNHVDVDASTLRDVLPVFWDRILEWHWIDLWWCNKILLIKVKSKPPLLLILLKEPLREWKSGKDLGFWGWIK
jgi:hypothetical protein